MPNKSKVAQREPEVEVTLIQDSPVQIDKEAALEILKLSGQPLPLNLDKLNLEKAKTASTENYPVPYLATTIVKMALGVEGVKKLQGRAEFRCLIAGPVEGNDNNRSCKFVQVYRNKDSAFVNIDFNHVGLREAPVKPHLYVAFAVSSSSAWKPYRCGDGWMIDGSKDPEDIEMVTGRLVRALLLKIVYHRDKMQVV